MKLIAEFVDAAREVLESAIKLIILVLAYLFLALDLLIYILGSLSMLALLALLAGIMNFTFEWSLFYTKITIGTGSTLEFKYEIYYKYYEIIDLELPVQRFLFKYNDKEGVFLCFETSLIEPILFKYDTFNSIVRALFTEQNNDNDNNQANAALIKNNNPNLNNFTLKTNKPRFIESGCEVEYPEVVALKPFYVKYRIADDDPIENYNDGHEVYSLPYRFRIKVEKIGTPVEYYVAGKKGNWSEVWDECPTWPEHDAGFNASIQYIASIKWKIILPEVGLYNITCEIKDNDNQTASHSLIVKAYPGFVHLIAGVASGSVTALIPYLIWASLATTNDPLKILAGIALSIFTIALPIFMVWGNYLVFESLGIDFLNFWGYLLGVGYAFMALGINMFLVILLPKIHTYLIPIITAIILSIIFFLGVLNPYYNYKFEMFIINLIIAVAIALIKIIKYIFISKGNENKNPINNIKKGTGVTIGLIHFFTGLFFMFIAQAYIKSELK
ncbi:MAG: hypothetical protein ACTSRP_24590 [Candidatus Helarchaeota archaeon]